MMSTLRSAPEACSLLVIGHPGHELRVYGWIGQVQPIVCILTDGSGSDGKPRLDKTLEILHESGAKIEPLCGELGDREIYEKILSHEYDSFDTLCERLSRLITAQNIDLVVSDAIEGYNPVHDLCEALVRTAVGIAKNANDAENNENAGKTRNGTPCSNRHYTVPLTNDPRPATGSMEAHHTIELTPPRFEQKLEAMRSYAASAGGILQEEVRDAFHSIGEQAFAREYLFEATAPGQEPEALSNIRRSGAKYLLATGHEAISVNTDITTGGWRSVNLMLAPFNLSAPLERIVENPQTGKILGIWALGKP